MVRDNTALHETPFTVSVDVKGRGTTTGISAAIVPDHARPDRPGTPRRRTSPGPGTSSR
jgi:3,4-dihydroxy 2-butanone 4-phosphate synthase/GTP cyclohydrolase II